MYMYCVCQHTHLDGCISADLFFETAQRRGIDLPHGVKCAADLVPYISVPDSCRSLTECLKVFLFFTPIVKGDAIAIRQMAIDGNEHISQPIIYA